MLGKLLKHEFRQSARSVSLIYACAAAVIAFIFVGMLTKITWIGVVGSIVLYITALVGVMMTLVSVIKNFYDTLYSNQGYLSFTLPVNCASLLGSKVIAAIVWVILSFVLAAVCFLVIAMNAKAVAEGSMAGIWDIIELTGLKEMLPSGATLVKLGILFAVSVLLLVFTFVGFVFFAVTMANTRVLQKHPKLFGFLIFFFTYGVTNAVGTKLTYSVPLSLEITTEDVKLAFVAMDQSSGMLSYGLAGVLFMALVAVGLLLLTGWIMEHKVNIK
ncbi:MAG: hypothetical protein II621_05070 [Clostridia bacterium]|jgi:hypothetical protein|nr:hypothetical protein [Clostridia bacterium]MBQ4366198.1 hypothetical protein [Clostridia bacterium]MBR3094140.1 hypothetical protein [Clostridia bacterium]